MRGRAAAASSSSHGLYPTYHAGFELLTFLRRCKKEKKKKEQAIKAHVQRSFARALRSAINKSQLRLNGVISPHDNDCWWYFTSYRL